MLVAASGYPVATSAIADHLLPVGDSMEWPVLISGLVRALPGIIPPNDQLGCLRGQPWSSASACAFTPILCIFSAW